MLSVYHLEALAAALAVIVLAGVASPVVLEMRRNKQAFRQIRLNAGRFTVAVLLMATLIGGCFLVPLPQSLRIAVVAEYAPAVEVSVARGGTLDHAVPYGTRIERGQVIAKLRNAILRKEKLTAQGRVDSLSQALKNLRFQGEPRYHFPHEFASGRSEPERCIRSTEENRAENRTAHSYRSLRRSCPAADHKNTHNRTSQPTDRCAPGSTEPTNSCRPRRCPMRYRTPRRNPSSRARD